jgi:hypothetical protein
MSLKNSDLSEVLQRIQALKQQLHPEAQQEHDPALIDVLEDSPADALDDAIEDPMEQLPEAVSEAEADIPMLTDVYEGEEPLLPISASTNEPPLLVHEFAPVEAPGSAFTPVDMDDVPEQEVFAENPSPLPAETESAEATLDQEMAEEALADAIADDVLDETLIEKADVEQLITQLLADMQPQIHAAARSAVAQELAAVEYSLTTLVEQEIVDQLREQLRGDWQRAQRAD